MALSEEPSTSALALSHLAERAATTQWLKRQDVNYGQTHQLNKPAHSVSFTMNSRMYELFVASGVAANLPDVTVDFDAPERCTGRKADGSSQSNVSGENVKDNFEDECDIFEAEENVRYRVVLERFDEEQFGTLVAFMDHVKRRLLQEQELLAFGNCEIQFEKPPKILENEDSRVSCSTCNISIPSTSADGVQEAASVHTMQHHILPVGNVLRVKCLTCEDIDAKDVFLIDERILEPGTLVRRVMEHFVKVHSLEYDFVESQANSNAKQSEDLSAFQENLSKTLDQVENDLANNVYNVKSRWIASEQRIVCPFCGQKLPTRRERTRHIQKVHPLTDLHCGFCYRVAPFASKADQEKHIDKHLRGENPVTRHIDLMFHMYGERFAFKQCTGKKLARFLVQG